MQRRFLIVAAVLISLTASLSAADPQLLGLMMPDAKIVAGANVGQILSSPFGQYVLAQVPTSDPTYQMFVLATGFDPMRNLYEVVAAAPGGSGQSSVLVAVRGAFNVAQIVAVLQSTGATVTERNGAQVISIPDMAAGLAFISNSVVIAGDNDSVTAALDRLSSPGQLDAALLTKANQLSSTQDVWAVTSLTPGANSIPIPSLLPGLNLNALQNLQQSSLGVKFGASVQVSLEAIAANAQDASSLADIVRLVVAFANINPSNPRTAEIGQVLQSLTVQTNGNALDLAVSIPETLLEQIVNSSMGSRAAGTSRRRK